MANNKIRRNGSYAPLSAHYYKDDAIAEVGWKAELLYVRGLAFCADVLSDGIISDVQLSRFVSVGISGYASLAKELDRVGLWVRDDDERGYWVARWEKWNLTRTEIEDRSDATPTEGRTVMMPHPQRFRTDSPNVRTWSTLRNATPLPGLHATSPRVAASHHVVGR